MPQFKIIFLCSLAGLPVLATIGCSKAAERNAEEIAKVQRTAQHVEDMQQIQTLMNKHMYYYATGQFQRELDEIWAMNVQGVSWGTDEGYWVDAKEIQEYYVDYFGKLRAAHPEAGKAKESASPMLQAAPPVIEISDDGQTAQGLWYPVAQGDVREAYGVEFYKPLDDWKIWHFFVHRDGAVPAGERAEKPADGPAPSVRPDTKAKKSPYAMPSGFLKAPVPFKAISLTFSYGPPDNR